VGGGSKGLRASLSKVIIGEVKNRGENELKAVTPPSQEIFSFPEGLKHLHKRSGGKKGNKATTTTRYEKRMISGEKGGGKRLPRINGKGPRG